MRTKANYKLYSLAAVTVAVATTTAGVAILSRKSADDQLLRWGLPGPAFAVEAFAVGYDGRSKEPAWTYEYLDADRLAGESPKERAFTSDGRVPLEQRSSNRDYSGSGYDRGHQVPLADQRGDASRCSLLTNIVPQTGKLNRGIWKQLEEYIRTLAMTHGNKVWIGTFALWIPDSLPPMGEETVEVVTLRMIGPDHVWVPTHCGKAILIECSGKREMMAWVLPNSEGPFKGGLDGARVSVDFIEHWAGVDLFTGLPDDEEAELESSTPSQ